MKKGAWKIIIGVIIVVAAVLGGYYYYQNQTDQSSMENAMVTASKDYFKNYMSANSAASAYKVTLEMLKKSNNQGQTNYELNELSICKDTSYVTVTINPKNGEIKDAVAHVECNKLLK